MANGIEKRRCRRFEIPGAEIRFKKRGLLSFMQALSGPCPASNISKGGLAFTCEKNLSKGTKLTMQLLIPDETTLDLIAVVRRQESMGGDDWKHTGVEFMPFGERLGWNEPESLDILRELDKKYGSD